MSIGLSPDFSIHDREDSADLMNLCRHELGLSATESRFPAKGTCRAIYSRAVNSGEELAIVLLDHFPWCRQWEVELRQLFLEYVTAKQAQNVLDYDDLLLAWAQVMEEPAFADHIGGMWDHVLIDEYQDTNRLQSRMCEVGAAMNVHLARHLAAFIFLDVRAGHYEEVRRLLGHSSTGSTLDFYASFETDNVGRRYSELIEEKRERPLKKGRR